MKLEDYYLTFGDIALTLKRRRRLIGITALIFSLLGSFYVMSRPAVFEAKAHFRELGKNESGGSVSITRALLGGSKNAGSQAVSALKSRAIIEDAVRRHHFQGQVIPEGSTPTIWHHIFDQFRVMLAHFKNWEEVSTSAPTCTLCLEDIHYAGERTISLTLDFTSSDTFLVKSSFGTVGEGQVGVPFRTDHFSFTVMGAPQPDVKRYTASIMPLSRVVSALENGVTIELDEDDTTLVVLEYSHPNRSYAVDVLNAIMESYQNYLEREQARFADIQLSYLKRRQEEMFDSQTVVMQKHAAMLSQDLSTSGFVNFEKEMEFLFKNRLGCLEKIHAIDLQLKRLKELSDDGPSRSGDILTHRELAVVHPALEELLHLKVQRDALTLALTESNRQVGDLEREISALDEVNRDLNDLADIALRIEAKEPVDPALPLLLKERFQVGGWVRRLSAESGERQNHETEACLLYLANLRRLLEMKRRICEERLTYQSGQSPEFQGIDLETAVKLHLGYINEAHQLDGVVNESRFIIEQLEDPDFEINSLSATLTDPISQEIIRKSSNHSLQLRDQKYHSPKEQERTKEELATQKRFLKAHLGQTLEVKQLHSDLLQGRMHALQGTMLELIHEKISVLENHIADYILAEINSLKQQKTLILDTMNEINQNMATLPDKWLSEQLMKQNVDLNKAIVEELTRLVESKNISHNLQLIESAPLDLAWTKPLPRSPRLFLVATVFACFGAFFSAAFVLVRQTVRGVIATRENLEAFDQTVLGHFDETALDPASDHNLNLLRQLSTQLDRCGKILLAVPGEGPNYVRALAKLMVRKRQKVLILNSLSSEPGLLQFLQGSLDTLPIHPSEGIATVFSGGASRYWPELLESTAFKCLLRDLLSQYDRILLVCHEAPTSADVTALMPLVDLVALTLAEETLPEISRTFNALPKIVFMFGHP